MPTDRRCSSQRQLGLPGSVGTANLVMTGKKNKLTAAEFLAQLQADPEYQQRVAARRAKIDALVEAEAREAAQLVADLRSVGEPAVWDLVNARRRYPRAIPVLLDHLQRSYSDHLKEVIARALAVEEARPYWPTILEEYERSDDGAAGSKFALALALAQSAGPSELEEILRLLRERRHGESRLGLLFALKRLAPREALHEFEDDPDLTLEVRHMLRKRRRRD